MQVGFKFLLFIFLIFGCQQIFAEDRPATLAPPPVNQNTQPASWVAHLLREKAGGEHIALLGTPEVVIPVMMVHQDDKFRPLVDIPFRFDRSGWKLFTSPNIPMLEDGGPGQYRVYAYLNGRVNLIDLVAHGPEGAVEYERIYLVAPEAQEFKVLTPWDAVRLSIGSTFLTYKQTSYVAYHSWTGLLSVQAHSPENEHRVGILGEADMTVLNVASNQSYGPQVGQAFLDGLYFFPVAPNSRWRSQLLVGVDYITMIGNGAPFGFSNLYSVEIGARAREIINAKTDYVYEFKYAPLGSSLFDVDNHGITASFSRSWLLPNLHRGELGLRYVDFSYHSNSTVVVTVDILSLLFSYSL